MKKSKVLKIVGLIIIIVVLGLIFTEISLSKIPKLQVSQDSKNIEIVRGSYCWRSLLNKVCICTIGPEELLKDIEPTKVKSEDNLLFEFSTRPNEVDVYIYERNQKINYDIEKGLLIGPKEKGIYIIDVTARWDRGDVSYVFTIKVE